MTAEMWMLPRRLVSLMSRHDASLLQRHRLRLGRPDVIGGVEVIDVAGILLHKAENSFGCSYRKLQAQIARAARDPNVKGVAFEVDSFGGQVSGAFETASMIAELGKIKPTIAILTDHALSAGYLLASACRQIIMPRLGMVGSIGVITLHADYSAALEREGIGVTIIAAGEHKADGNPYSALPPEVAARVRAELENARQSFAEHVGRFRGRRFTTPAALATEAQEFDGPDAVRLGLADAVGDANEAFANFIAAVSRATKGETDHE